MALPVILSTAAQSLYNIVDGIFVSMLGEDAMAAITFAGPCTKVLIALGTGIAVEMNTMHFSSEKAKHGLGKDDVCIPGEVILADGTDATELIHEAEKFLNDSAFAQYEV